MERPEPRPDSSEEEKEAAWIVVNNILTDLLKDVFSHVERCTTIHGNGEEHGATRRKAKRRDSNELVDVVCRFGDPLTGYSHRSSSFQIIQLTVAKQHKEGYCGHYALHNALLARKMCHADNEEELQELFQIMKSTSAYWWRYWLSLKQLMNCVTPDTWWPWTEDHIVTGDMERSFLHYLLDSHYHPRSRSELPIHVIQVKPLCIPVIFIMPLFSSLRMDIYKIQLHTSSNYTRPLHLLRTLLSLLILYSYWVSPTIGLLH